jgi:hypothetical protein
MRIRLHGSSTLIENWLKIKLPEHEMGSQLENPDVVVGIAQCSLGGIPDPLAALDDAIACGILPITLVVAGRDDKVIDRAKTAGVADECIIKGERIMAGELLLAIKEACEKEIRPEPVLIFPEQPPAEISQPVVREESFSEYGSRAECEDRVENKLQGGNESQHGHRMSVNWDLLLPYKDRILVVTGPAGGVGRSTLAASLMSYMTGQGESIAGVDLASSLKRHLGNPELKEGDGGYLRASTRWGEVWQVRQDNPEGIAVVIGLLAQKGNWVIVDTPPGTAPWHNFANIIWVVGNTLRQLGDRDSVPAGALLVTSLVAEDPVMWASVVDDVLGRTPDVIIEYDPEGCRTTEAEMSPAIEGAGRSPGSPTISAAVGKIAALLSSRGVWRG